MYTRYYPIQRDIAFLNQQLRHSPTRPSTTPRRSRNTEVNMTTQHKSDSKNQSYDGYYHFPIESSEKKSRNLGIKKQRKYQLITNKERERGWPSALEAGEPLHRIQTFSDAANKQMKYGRKSPFKNNEQNKSLSPSVSNKQKESNVEASSNAIATNSSKKREDEEEKCFMTEPIVSLNLQNINNNKEAENEKQPKSKRSSKKRKKQPQINFEESSNKMRTPSNESQKQQIIYPISVTTPIKSIKSMISRRCSSNYPKAQKSKPEQNEKRPSSGMERSRERKLEIEITSKKDLKLARKLPYIREKSLSFGNSPCLSQQKGSSSNRDGTSARSNNSKTRQFVSRSPHYQKGENIFERVSNSKNNLIFQNQMEKLRSKTAFIRKQTNSFSTFAWKISDMPFDSQKQNRIFDNREVFYAKRSKKRIQ